jgi:type I restriction enzyme S subunit
VNDLSDWRVVPFWSLFRRSKNTGYPEEQLLSVYRDHGVIPKDSRDDNHNRESDDLSSYQLVDRGWLAINKMKAWQGSLGISRFRGIVSPAYFVYRPTSNEHDQFLHYLLRSRHYAELFLRISKGVRINQWDLEHEALRTIMVRLPPTGEQKEIAELLDRETARIDQLIERKHQFGLSLDQRFQSVISAVVTGQFADLGNAVRTTGYEWNPVIPKHWSTTRLKFLCSRVVDCLHETPAHAEVGEFPAIRTADIARGKVLLDRAKRVSLEEYLWRVQRLEPERDDILYTREGERFGLAALVPPNTKLCLGQRMMMFRIREKISSAYVMWSLNGGFAYHFLKQSTAGATSPHLNIADIRNVPIFLPPEPEQQKLASYLSQKQVELDSLVLPLERSIDRLQELRAALITAAVTGQLDMKTWVKRGGTERQLYNLEAEAAV